MNFGFFCSNSIVPLSFVVNGDHVVVLPLLSSLRSPCLCGKVITGGQRSQ